MHQGPRTARTALTASTPAQHPPPQRAFMPTSSRMPTALPAHSHTSWSPRPRSLSLQGGRAGQAAQGGWGRAQGTWTAERGTSGGWAGRGGLQCPCCRDPSAQYGCRGCHGSNLPRTWAAAAAGSRARGCRRQQAPTRRHGPGPHLRGLKRTATHTLFFWLPSTPSYCIICVMFGGFGRCPTTVGACTSADSAATPPEPCGLCCCVSAGGCGPCGALREQGLGCLAPWLLLCLPAGC